MAMGADENNLIWIDLEMTGLDPFRDQIIEITTLVTDARLNILAEGPVIAIQQPDYILDGMDDKKIGGQFSHCNIEQYGKMVRIVICYDARIEPLSSDPPLWEATG